MAPSIRLAIGHRRQNLLSLKDEFERARVSHSIV